jgi:hypothetical protein
MTNAIQQLAKAHLFYIHKGMRYLIRSCADNTTMLLVRKGNNGDADHLELKYSEVLEHNFAVRKEHARNLAGAGYNYQKYKKDDLYINPALGVSADEVRALQASSQYETLMKERSSQLAIDENVALISRSILGAQEETEVCVFVYKPADLVVEAISQFFNRKGFWVEYERVPNGNVAFTLYW